jgi:uncharacterized protein YbaR (Trm112 family)
MSVDGLTGRAYFDRQLVAFMLREEIPVILTENAKNFTGIDGIRPINRFG